MEGTPRSHGFRMPAEWAPHKATWLAWPHNREDWPGRFHPIPWVYAEIVRKLAEVERVRILVNDDAAESAARRVLRKANANLAAVEFFPVKTNRVWIRDFGPIFVTDDRGARALTNWKFNAWAKYDDWQLDNAVNAQLQPRLELPVWSPDIVLEGGSIDVNGAGLLLTTEECLLSPVQARNPHLTREQIEQALSGFLGVDRVLWLRNGIVGDDTHGHVDDLARFVDRETVVIASEEDPRDANFELLEENWRLLREMPVRAVKLPMPAPVVFEGRRLPASYANFYIANRLVLAPTFNDPNDRIALNTLASVFPDRKVVGINCVELVWGLGTLHCMTQQEPAGNASY